MPDEHLIETVRQCQNATPLGRLNATEAMVAVRWLIDNGHMTRTGKALEQPLQAPVVVARKGDGSPIYPPGTDFSTHRTVTMSKAG